MTTTNRKSRFKAKNTQSTRPVGAKPKRVVRQTKPNQSPPPVMARGFDMDIPYQANKMIHKTRRLDVPLNIPGAEVHLPSVPMFRLTFRWIIFGLIVLLSGVIYLLFNAPFFQVESPQVRGLVRVRSEDINAVLDLRGQTIFSLRSGELKSKLQLAFPEFSSVTVEIKLPNQVLLAVEERVPVMSWKQADSIQLIDQQGYAFPFRLGFNEVITPVVEASANPPALALSPQEILSLVNQQNNLTGSLSTEKNEEGSLSPVTRVDPEIIRPFMTTNLVSAVLSIYDQMPKDAILIYDANHGLGWQDQGGWKVFLGDDRDINLKLEIYQAILVRLDEEDTYPELISIEHLNTPYIRVGEREESEQ